MVTDEILYTQVPSFNAVFFFFFPKLFLYLELLVELWESWSCLTQLFETFVINNLPVVANIRVLPDFIYRLQTSNWHFLEARWSCVSNHLVYVICDWDQWAIGCLCIHSGLGFLDKVSPLKWQSVSRVWQHQATHDLHSRSSASLTLQHSLPRSAQSHSQSLSHLIQ